MSVKHQEMYLRIWYILEEIDYANLYFAEKYIKNIDHHFDEMTIWLGKLERMYFENGFLKYTDNFGEKRSKKIMQLTIFELWEMMKGKVDLLHEIEGESHIKAYSFILRMVKAGIHINTPKTRQRNQSLSDIRLISEMHKAFTCLGIQDEEDKSIKSLETSKVDIDESIYEEFFLDKFDSFEDMNEYYQQMMGQQRIDQFQKEIQTRQDIFEKVLQSETSLTSDQLKTPLPTNKFPEAFVEELVEDVQKNEQVQIQHKQKISALSKKMSSKQKK